MHATIEQLIDIKDGLENEQSLHVLSCRVCQSELNSLKAIGHSLYESANHTPPPDAWAKIQASAKSQEATEIPQHLLGEAHMASIESVKPVSRFNWNSLSSAVYTLALSVVFTGFISLYTVNQQATSNQQTEMLQASIEQLMLHSRGLESVLQRVAVQNESLSDAETKIAERLYWRLQYVDQMINENAGNDRIDGETVKALWGDRVNALNQLNQLYYGQQPNLGNREI